MHVSDLEHIYRLITDDDMKFSVTVDGRLMSIYFSNRLLRVVITLTWLYLHPVNGNGDGLERIDVIEIDMQGACRQVTRTLAWV